MSKLRLIQCGMGGMGNAWWRGATGKSPDFDLAAIVDVAQKPLDDAGDALNIPRERRFTTLEAALEKIEADAVLTVTPPPVHVQHAKLAFAKGLHLITEKPLADTLENAKLMVKLARDAGKQLVVAQNYRFSPPIQHLKTLVREKTTGEIGHGHLDFYIPADFTGTFREKMEFPLLVDMSIHHMDLIRCITGRNVRKVTALSYNTKWSWYAHDAGLKMLLQLDDGVAFSYSGDWTSKTKMTTWNGSWNLQGESGAITMADDRIVILKSEMWGKNQSLWPQGIPGIPLEAQAKLLSDFAAAIRTGTPAETSGEDNLWSFSAVMAGVISAKEGRTVDVAELIGK